MFIPLSCVLAAATVTAWPRPIVHGMRPATVTMAATMTREEVAEEAYWRNWFWDKAEAAIEARAFDSVRVLVCL